MSLRVSITWWTGPLLPALRREGTRRLMSKFSPELGTKECGGDASSDAPAGHPETLFPGSFRRHFGARRVVRLRACLGAPMGVRQVLGASSVPHGGVFGSTLPAAFVALHFRQPPRLAIGLFLLRPSPCRTSHKSPEPHPHG